MLHHLLKVIPAFRSHPDLIPLNGRLNFDRELFNDTYALFGLVLREALQEGHFLPETTIKGFFRRLEIEGLLRDLSARHPHLKDVLKIPQFHIIIRNEADLFFFFVLKKFHGAFTALEIKPGLELFLRLIHGIVDFLKIDLRYDVEGG